MSIIVFIDTLILQSVRYTRSSIPTYYSWASGIF
jgi:hypothetical protein